MWEYHGFKLSFHCDPHYYLGIKLIIVENENGGEVDNNNPIRKHVELV